MIDCDEVTLVVKPPHSLPTLSAERCQNVHLYFHEPEMVGSIYTVQCPKLLVYFQPPHAEKTEVALESDDNNQYVTKYVDSQFSTSKVVRGEQMECVDC